MNALRVWASARVRVFVFVVCVLFLTVTSSHTQDHLNRCNNRNMSCDACGQLFRASQQQAHALSCARALRACEYAPYGCSAQVRKKRKERDERGEEREGEREEREERNRSRREKRERRASREGGKKKATKLKMNEVKKAVLHELISRLLASDPCRPVRTTLADFPTCTHGHAHEHCEGICSNCTPFCLPGFFYCTPVYCL